jgi:hypothetical protein
MDRRATLKFLASLPLVGLLFRPTMADAAEVPGLAWSRSEMTSRSPTIGGDEPSFMLTSLSFAVTREELERRWVEHSPNAKVPDSGLIRRFRSAIEIYQNCRMPDYWPSTETGRDVIQPGKIHIEFQEESGKPWGQQHDITVMAEEVFKRKRYAIIDRALQHLKLQCRRAAIPADLDALKFVQVRFLHG